MAIQLNGPDNPVESIWVKVRGKGNTHNIVVGIYYRLPGPGENVDDAFFKQLTDIARKHEVVVMGNF